MPSPSYETLTIRAGEAIGWMTLSTHVRSRERKHPIWELRYALPSGKKSDKSLGKAWTKSSRAQRGFVTRTEAAAEAQAFLAQFADGRPEDRDTFGRACDKFLHSRQHEDERTDTTIHSYRQMADRLRARCWHGELTWESRPLDSFTAKDIMRLRTELVGTLAPSTVNKYRTVIRGAFGVGSAQAKAWEWKALSKTKVEGSFQYYNPEEVALVLANARDDRDRLAYMMAAELGLRKGEILGMRCGPHRMDFKNRIVHVEEGFTAKGGFAGVKSHRKRTLPMTDNVAHHALPFCQGQPRDAVLFGREDDPDIPICGYSLLDRFLALCEQLGLHRIVFHDLRHSFGTEMIKDPQVDIFQLQVLMGHADIKTTMLYLHHQSDPKMAAIMSSRWSPVSAAPATSNVVRLRRPSEKVPTQSSHELQTSEGIELHSTAPNDARTLGLVSINIDGKKS